MTDLGHDVYAAAREEYRKKIAEQAAEIEKLRKDLSMAVFADSEYCKVLEREIERLRAALRTASDMNDIYENRLQEKEAENERLRAALERISLMDKQHEHDLFSATQVARAALEDRNV